MAWPYAASRTETARAAGGCAGFATGSARGCGIRVPRTADPRSRASISMQRDAAMSRAPRCRSCHRQQCSLTACRDRTCTRERSVRRPPDLGRREGGGRTPVMRWKRRPVNLGDGRRRAGVFRGERLPDPISGPKGRRVQGHPGLDRIGSNRLCERGPIGAAPLRPRTLGSCLRSRCPCQQTRRFETYGMSWA